MPVRRIAGNNSSTRELVLNHDRDGKRRVTGVKPGASLLSLVGGDAIVVVTNNALPGTRSGPDLGAFYNRVSKRRQEQRPIRHPAQSSEPDRLKGLLVSIKTSPRTKEAGLVCQEYPPPIKLDAPIGEDEPYHITSKVGLSANRP